VLKYVYCLIFLLFFSLPCHAQDEGIFPTSYGSDGSSGSRSTAEEEDFGLDLNTPARLNILDIRRNYSIDFPDYWDSYAHSPSVTYRFRYRGLRGLIHKQIMRGIGKFYDQALKNFWNESYLSPYDQRRLMQKYSLEAGDAGNRWWEQRQHFFDHYSIENGGHSVELVQVGERYDIASVGPITVTNEGRFSWSGWRFSISPERDIPDKRIRGPEYEQPQRTQEQRQYSLGIHVPRGNIFTGENWTVSSRIKFGIRLDDLARNKSSVTCDIRIIGYTGLRKVPWLGINIKGRARPFRNDYGVQVTFALLRF
jgi:hypothetical protein